MVKVRLKRARVEGGLREEKDIITVLKLERKLDFTRGTLSKFYAGNRKLTTQEIKIIDTYIQGSLNSYFDS